MTPIRSIASADQQHVWPERPRITEVSSLPLGSKEQSARTISAEILRRASAYLQAGWKWLELKRTQQLSSRRLRLAETISLGEKRSVSIVQVDGAQFLIGCSTGSVQLLAVLDKKDDGIYQSSDIGRAS